MIPSMRLKCPPWDCDQTLDRIMNGSLLYLIVNCPYLCYSMGVCARYQASPKDTHLLVVKKIIKFFDTTKCGIWYTQYTTTSLVAYCDAD